MFQELLVIDVSTVLAGPSVGTFFAELGSQVIKIEHAKNPDVTRSWKLPNEDSTSTISAYFSSINYGKAYQKLDLRITEDRDRFLSYIDKADILISNFKKGDAEKFQINDEILFQRNPRLIIGKINGYGNDSDRVAYDLILQAESGFMSINGTAESGPVKMPVALIDVLAAHHLKEAILVKLLERTQSEKGAVVSVSLYEAAVSSLVNQASNYLMTGTVPKRIGSLHPNIAPYGEIFQTKDEALITFAIGSNRHFELLCDYLDLSNLTEMHPTNQDRVKNRTEIFNEIAEKVRAKSAEEILSNMQALNVPVGKIKDLSEVFEDEQVKKLVLNEIIDGQKTQRVASKIFK